MHSSGIDYHFISQRLASDETGEATQTYITTTSQSSLGWAKQKRLEEVLPNSNNNTSKSIKKLKYKVQNIKPETLSMLSHWQL